MGLRTVPLNLAEANLLIGMWHRHHQPIHAHRFSLGVIDGDGAVHGACVVARPVARNSGPAHEVAEVTRLVTDGTPNACSILYAAAARAARNMGYTRIQTFILATEPGTSLKASGWRNEGTAQGGKASSWGNRAGRQGFPQREPAPLGVKQRWALELNPAPPPLVFPADPDAVVQGTLL